VVSRVKAGEPKPRAAGSMSSAAEAGRAARRRAAMRRVIEAA
jgi:hypothetical protein